MGATCCGGAAPDAAEDPKRAQWDKTGYKKTNTYRKKKITDFGGSFGGCDYDAREGQSRDLCDDADDGVLDSEKWDVTVLR